LVKLHKAGAISGPDDPEAVFYAHLVKASGATSGIWLENADVDPT
jgi:hypothetical protein